MMSGSTHPVPEFCAQVQRVAWLGSLRDDSPRVPIPRTGPGQLGINVLIEEASMAVASRRATGLGTDLRVTGERGAAKFFWAVLISATCASVAGNVTHAVINVPARAAFVAAAVALVPPAVLLGATHSVAVLVRTRASAGFSYWCALAMTLALAFGAFVLSFDALRALAITAGIAPGRAWLWPLVIDMSIAQSTIALLSLTVRHRRSGRTGVATSDSAKPPAVGGARMGPQPRRAVFAAVADAAERLPSATPPPPHRAAAGDWLSFADLLISHGVTSIERDKVAKVLAESAAKTPPTTIGRRWDVHHSTVKRIQAAAKELTG
ncbi:MAG: hypothetical protein JWR32_4045 [Mycobacterium sp.]|jgi:hypothetical protein|nr:hypothetical protein [Mycobacterium sp.]